MQANIRDITASKQAEAEREKLQAQLQQAQKMESIGTLTGGIAHDFNNILAIILGYTEIAQVKIPASSPAQKSLDEVKTAGIRARDIVKQLLAFSRKSKQEKQILDIRPIVKEALQMLRSTIPTSIAFESAFPDKLPSVKVDATQIHQVMINLCTNAAQSMEGEGTLGVRLDKVSLDTNGIYFDENLTPGDFVKLSVSDTGPGIATEDLQRIFDPYFTSKEVGQGSGLGLSVVLGIVKSHGGGIRVDSEVGIGTTFEIYLPATGEKQATPEVETRQDLPTGSERILFVDDEKMIIKLNQQRLERLGYTMTCATDPLQALEMLKNNPDQFDLLITDMTMPQMTGDKLAIEVLNFRPDMPIILCTGHSDRISEDSARDVGLAKYLKKPLDMQTLSTSVREVLDRQRV